jgi:metal transporter CNNM
MSLDIKGLEVVNGSGTKKEQIYARALLPLRAKGNFLLCTLLLGNTAVNAVLAIFLGSMTSCPVLDDLSSRSFVLLLA